MLRKARRYKQHTDRTGEEPASLAEEEKQGEKPENIARYCLDFIAETIIAMTDSAIEKYGRYPLVLAGGVMSDKLIRDRIVSLYPDAAFAAPEFSCDNASGVAIYGYLKQMGEKKCL